MADFRSLEIISESYDNRSPCVLRDYFEKLEGNITNKEINLTTTEGVVGIEHRPDFAAYINIQKFKELDEGCSFFFNESIETNEPFIVNFKSFLKASSRDVKSSGFEGVPETFKKWYKTPFTMIPVDVSAKMVTLRVPGDKLSTMLSYEEKIKGVDYDRSSTLRMVKAKTLEEKLTEIEKKAIRLSAMITYHPKDVVKGSIEAMEVKHGFAHYALTRI
jgi:hypothetical protein